MTRARFHKRIVCHRYGDRELQVVIASQYGQRYDHDWSELAEIAALKQGDCARAPWCSTSARATG